MLGSLSSLLDGFRCAGFAPVYEIKDVEQDKENILGFDFWKIEANQPQALNKKASVISSKPVPAAQAPQTPPKELHYLIKSYQITEASIAAAKVILATARQALAKDSKDLSNHVKIAESCLTLIAAIREKKLEGNEKDLMAEVVKMEYEAQKTDSNDPRGYYIECLKMDFRGVPVDGFNDFHRNRSNSYRFMHYLCVCYSLGSWWSFGFLKPIIEQSAHIIRENWRIQVEQEKKQSNSFSFYEDPSKKYEECLRELDELIKCDFSQQTQKRIFQHKLEYSYESFTPFPVVIPTQQKGVIQNLFTTAIAQTNPRPQTEDLRMASALKTYDPSSIDVFETQTALAAAEKAYKECPSDIKYLLTIAEKALSLAAVEREKMKQTYDNVKKEIHQRKIDRLVKYVYSLSKTAQSLNILDPNGYYVECLSTDFKGVKCQPSYLGGNWHHYIYNIRLCYMLDPQRFSFFYDVFSKVSSFCESQWATLEKERKLTYLGRQNNSKLLSSYSNKDLLSTTFINHPELFKLRKDPSYAYIFSRNPDLQDPSHFLVMHQGNVSVEFVQSIIQLLAEEAQAVGKTQ